MIRRTHIGASGDEQWLLIPQIDHAHLAAQIAKAWGAEPFAALWPADQMIAAVNAHDDGWAEWDARPGVDPAEGRPRDFTEMRIADSVAIWRRSIEVAADIGPLAAWVVSGHFSALLRRTNAWQATAATPSDTADAFLREQDARRIEWLEAWQAPEPQQRTLVAATRSMEFLQFFDALSLWLCCGRARDHRSTAPGGPAFNGQQSCDPRGAVDLSVELRPWPLRTPELRLEVVARAVAARHYANDNDLAAARGELLGIYWHLRPGN